MAASRKLQGEIDRCLKKVQEGVETFEDIWQKVHNATNTNQKEKYEADLKKEIKKLQRLRDQIKSWIASGEIKDKSVLMDNRKLIETQMERFKVVERETKTKAYSKEGLGAAQKLDPAQKEREEIQNWLVNSIDSLNIQIDSFECEIESLLVNKKKKLDKEKQERMEECKSRLEKHRFHIRKLEMLLRLLNNMSVEVAQIKAIKDDVEYYIECSQEPDFEKNEFIYDDIVGLDDVDLVVGLPLSTSGDHNESSSCPASPLPSPTHSDFSDRKSFKTLRPPSKGIVSTKTTSCKSIQRECPAPVTPVYVANFAAVAANSKVSNETILNKIEANQGDKKENEVNVNNVDVNENRIENDIELKDVVDFNGNANETSNGTYIMNGTSSPNVHIVPDLIKANSLIEPTAIRNNIIVSNATNPLRNIENHTNNHYFPFLVNNNDLNCSTPVEETEEKAPQVEQKSEAVISPLLGVAPLGAMPLQKEHQAQFELMEAAFYHMPSATDSERSRQYLPKSPCQTPSYYIQSPLPQSDLLDYYLRLSAETLFFIFYYMEGTKAQYLAAKALKRQSWRFHTKYMMWFQRHEEPKVINEQYEQGVYVYFDFERWIQKKKDGFTFEYKYLEDKDLN